MCIESASWRLPPPPFAVFVSARAARGPSWLWPELMGPLRYLMEDCMWVCADHCIRNLLLLSISLCSNSLCRSLVFTSHSTFCHSLPSLTFCLPVSRSLSHPLLCPPSSLCSSSRSSDQVWSTGDGVSYYQDVWIPGCSDSSVETMLWAEGRLVTAGFTGQTCHVHLYT